MLHGAQTSTDGPVHRTYIPPPTAVPSASLLALQALRENFEHKATWPFRDSGWSLFGGMCTLAQLYAWLGGGNEHIASANAFAGAPQCWLAAAHEMQDCLASVTHGTLHDALIGLLSADGMDKNQSADSSEGSAKSPSFASHFCDNSPAPVVADELTSSARSASTSSVDDCGLPLELAPDASHSMPPGLAAYNAKIQSMDASSKGDTSDVSSANGAASPGASLLASRSCSAPSGAATPQSQGGGEGEPLTLASLHKLGLRLGGTELNAKCQAHPAVDITSGCPQAQVKQQGGKPRGKSVTEARGNSVTQPPALSLPPGLDPKTPGYEQAEEAIAKLYAARCAHQEARKRPPTADQCYVARAVLRARDARYVLSSVPTDADLLRVEVLERDARSLCTRLNRNGVLSKATHAEKYVEKLETEAFAAVRAVQPAQRLSTSPAVTAHTIRSPRPPPIPKLAGLNLASSTVEHAVEWQRANFILKELLPSHFRPFQGQELLAWALGPSLDTKMLAVPAEQRPMLITLLSLPSLLPPSVPLPAMSEPRNKAKNKA
jgi:hypothetical protein